MNDFNQVVSWIFLQLNNVLDLISQHFLFRVALAVPIVGGFMVTVYYLLQSFDLNLFLFSKETNGMIKSKSFGSIQSHLSNPRLKTFSGFKSGSSLFKGTDTISYSDFARTLIKRKRRKKAQDAADKKREEERNKWRQEWQNKLKAEQASREYYDSHHINHSGSLNIDVD